jgi:hypothetical protein
MPTTSSPTTSWILFKIIVKYHINLGLSDNSGDLYSMSEDMKNVIIDSAKPRKKKHNSNIESYSSINNISKFYANND